jgi:hypothetical protein
MTTSMQSGSEQEFKLRLLQTNSGIAVNVVRSFEAMESELARIGVSFKSRYSLTHPLDRSPLVQTAESSASLDQTGDR